MAQVISSKIARCDWFLTWRDFSVMTVGIMKTVNALWTQNPKKKIKKNFLCLKIKKKILK